MAYRDQTNQLDSTNLTQSQIKLINKALKSIPDFGEVRLIIEKGILRFLVVNKSFKTIDISDEDVERINF